MEATHIDRSIGQPPSTIKAGGGVGEASPVSTRGVFHLAEILAR